MPSLSQSQRGLIFTKRNKYGSKNATPKKWQWIWHKGWENKGKLPEKVKDSRIYDFETFVNENFLNDVIDKASTKINKWIDNLSTTPSERLLDADFNDKELKILTNLGFVDNKLANHHELSFNSELNNIHIQIKKYWDEEFGPEYADSIFEIKINGKKQPIIQKFEDLIEKIKQIIPKINQTISKYNL